MRFVFAFLFAAICLCTAAASPGTSEPPVNPLPAEEGNGKDLSGIYECHGTEDGKDYSAIVMFLKVAPNTYVIQWSIGPGVNTTGIALRHGDTLSVAYTKGSLPCTGFYTVDQGRLIGRFVAPPDLKRTTETLEFKLAMPKSRATQ